MITIEKTNSKLELGLAINILATSIAIVLKELVNVSDSMITYSVYMLSFLLIADFSVFKTYKMKKSPALIVLTLFQLYILAYAILVRYSLINGQQAIVYTLFVLAFLFVVSTNIRALNGKIFVQYMLGISAILNVLMFYILREFSAGKSSIQFVYLTNGADRASMSMIPFLFFISIFCCEFKQKNWFVKAMLVLVLLCSFYNLFACNRRSMYIAIVVCACFVFFRDFLLFGMKTYNQTIVKWILLIAALTVGICVLSLLSEPVRNVLISSFESLKSGLLTLFGGDAQDAAVSMRNTSRAAAMQDFASNTAWQWLFGRGYAYAWIDFPILQAFLDLGLLAGFVFFGYFIVLPLVMIFCKVKYQPFEKLLICYMILTMLNCFISGTCYGHMKYCPLIIFIYVIVDGYRDRVNEGALDE